MVTSLDAFLSGIRPWLLSQARNLCRNQSDAEDLVQEACFRFLKAHPQVWPLQDENQCEAWIIRTMTNCFYDRLRKLKVEKLRQSDPGLEEVSVGRESPRSPFDLITDEEFAEGVKKLSPKLRSTFELFAAGTPYKEIAHRQGLTVGAVGRRLHAARNRLKEFLSATVKQGEN